jgi:hypothetical protein
MAGKRTFSASLLGRRDRNTRLGWWWATELIDMPGLHGLGNHGQLPIG